MRVGAFREDHASVRIGEGMRVWRVGSGNEERSGSGAERPTGVRVGADLCRRGHRCPQPTWSNSVDGRGVERQYGVCEAFAQRERFDRPDRGGGAERADAGEGGICGRELRVRGGAGWRWWCGGEWFTC